MHITEFLINWCTQFISATGYVGVFILMTGESMILPIPSEAVMPFAGFLVSSGRFTLLGIGIVSTLGSILGSSLSYLLGRYGGQPIILKYGKYLLLNEYHLRWTENFFAKRGDMTIFVSRFIPVVRHLISLPAGIARMSWPKFLLYTILGAAIWNTVLGYAGMILEQHWENIKKYSEMIDVIVVIGIVVVVVYFIWKQLRKHPSVTPRG